MDCNILHTDIKAHTGIKVYRNKRKIRKGKLSLQKSDN